MSSKSMAEHYGCTDTYRELVVTLKLYIFLMLMRWNTILCSILQFFLSFCPSQLFSVIPRHFLPDMKSPCWYEKFSNKLGTDPYRKNLYTLRSKSFKTVCDHLRSDFKQHLLHRNGNLFRLRCLPFFYIIGQPKCGTTDLFHRLLLHPEIQFNTMKEPHWWTRKRFGKFSGRWPTLINVL